MSDSTCIFCKIGRGEVPAKLAYQDAEVIAFHDISPAAPTHILIVPREHLVNLDDAKPTHVALMGKLILVAAQIAREQGIASDGYRLVANTGKHGGQSVWHLHWHLLGGRHMAWPPG